MNIQRLKYKSYDFILYQSLITGLRGITPFLILIYFTRVLNEIELSYFVALWSLGNVVSGFLLMSSHTVAPQYFFKTTTFTKESLIRSSYFQLIRLIFFIFTSLSILLYLFVFKTNYIYIIQFMLYNNIYSILPIWRYYSNRKIKNVLLTEVLYKGPIFVCIILYYLFNIELDLFRIMMCVSCIGILHIVIDIFTYFKFETFNKQYYKFALTYIKSIYNVNIITTLINSGQVYFISFIVSPALLNQIAVIDKLKNLFLQLQGVFISERISKNRSFLLNFKPTLKDYLSQNIHVFIISIITGLVLFVLSYTNLYDILFNVSINNHLIVFILLFNVVTTSFVLICVSHMLNSTGQIRKFRKIYLVSFAVLISCIIPLYYLTQFYSIVMIGLLFDVVILLTSMFVINERYFNRIVRVRGHI